MKWIRLLKQKTAEQTMAINSQTMEYSLVILKRKLKIPQWGTMMKNLKKRLNISKLTMRENLIFLPMMSLLQQIISIILVWDIQNSVTMPIIALKLKQTLKSMRCGIFLTKSL